jgi:hypothetical protein
MAWVVTGMILIKGLRDNKDVGRDTKNKRRGSSDKKGHRNIAREIGRVRDDMFRIQRANCAMLEGTVGYGRGAGVIRV